MGRDCNANTRERSGDDDVEGGKLVAKWADKRV